MKYERALTEAGAAAAIEAEGFDGAFTFDGPHDPFLPIAVAAGATTRLELGTAIAVAFARNPMTVAQTASDLQRLCSGRFYLGLGSQIRAHVERRFSMPWSHPTARMHEFVRAVRAIWHAWNTGERLDFRGEFYTHTLMSPMLSPGPNPFGDPPIFVAGVGEKMVEVAGEVGDGFLVHPLHTPALLRGVTLPALERGLSRSGRTRAAVQVSAQTIVAIGDTDEQLALARMKAKAQIAFYGSTPAYKGTLDFHGWGDLQPRLRELTRENRWPEMLALVPDAMLDAIAVSGRAADAGRALAKRNDFADRTSVIVYNEGDPGAVADLLAAARSGA